ncbi:MAG: hypothetical protein AAGC71_08250 [Pseudomonadota bacterium]
MAAVVLPLGILPYLAAVAFFHSHGKRSAVALDDAQLRMLRVLAWVLLLGSFSWTADLFGAVRGLFYQLFIVGLIMLASQWLATQWPRLHWWSGVTALPLLPLAMLN